MRTRALCAVPLACALALISLRPAHANSTANQGEPQSAGSTSTLTEKRSEGAVEYTDGQSSVKILEPDGSKAESASPQAKGRYVGCHLKVHYVHGSHHVKGTINGTVTVNCKYAGGGKASVSSLGLSYSLIRVSPNNKQWAAGMVNNSNKSKIANNRGVPCSEGAGRFQGWAQAEMTPPKGYKMSTPPTKKEYGKTKWVGCGDDGDPQSSSKGVSEEITVTFAPID
jgi:hypothetical protein